MRRTHHTNLRHGLASSQTRNPFMQSLLILLALHAPKHTTQQPSNALLYAANSRPKTANYIAFSELADALAETARDAAHGVGGALPDAADYVAEGAAYGFAWEC